MDESQEITRNTEVKMRARYFEHRRRSVGKCLSVLFRADEKAQQQRQGPGELAQQQRQGPGELAQLRRQGPGYETLSKDAELAIVVQKIKLRREMIRMSAHWLEICRASDSGSEDKT